MESKKIVLMNLFFGGLSIFFFPLFFISWRLITLQYFSGFCHTLICPLPNFLVQSS